MQLIFLSEACMENCRNNNRVERSGEDPEVDRERSDSKGPSNRPQQTNVCANIENTLPRGNKGVDRRKKTSKGSFAEEVSEPALHQSESA